MTSAAVYRPGAARQEPIRRVDRPTKTLALSVPDEVIVVRLTPTKKAPTGPVPAPPRNLRAVTTGNMATLSWQPPAGKNKPAGYFVHRMGAFVGRVSGGATAFRDERLLPGAGYTYTVSAYDAPGRFSPPISLVAQTRSEFPDLVVTDIGWAEPLQAGKPATLRATIVNRGNAPTPANVVHGVAFSVGGAVVCWSDTFRGPLKPGESRTVTANNGPKGAATWTPTVGAHVLRATVDDVHRIAESDDANNTLEKTVRVP